jgi:hypothetical protein
VVGGIWYFCDRSGDKTPSAHGLRQWRIVTHAGFSVLVEAMEAEKPGEVKVVKPSGVNLGGDA